MVTGVLIAESLRVGATLEGVPMTARKIWRIAPANTMSEQPATWTLMEFEVREVDAQPLAAALAAALDAPGWYADFHSATELRPTRTPGPLASQTINSTGRIDEPFTLLPAAPMPRRPLLALSVASPSGDRH